MGLWIVVGCDMLAIEDSLLFEKFVSVDFISPVFFDGRIGMGICWGRSRGMLLAFMCLCLDRIAPAASGEAHSRILIGLHLWQTNLTRLPIECSVRRGADLSLLPS